MAASAAGVGILALAQTSEAKIVYTPANVPIVGTVNIDLNHDGITDLGINLSHYADMDFLDASSLGRNRVWGRGFTASHLLAGVVIGPNQEKFAKGNMLCASSEAPHPIHVRSWKFFTTLPAIPLPEACGRNTKTVIWG
jgi:hypothetical protein